MRSAVRLGTLCGLMAMAAVGCETPPADNPKDAADGPVDMAKTQVPPDLSCAAPRVACGNSCTKLSDDRSNCGTCGNACMPGVPCMAGQCVPGCDPGKTKCAGTCVNLMDDNANCGACGKVCDNGKTCSKGMCECTAGQTV